MFYVVTDDILFAKWAFKKRGLVEKYAISFQEEPVSVGFDLALLSLADHSIMTHGTFGLWGALLSKMTGEVVLPKGYEITTENIRIKSANITNFIYM